MCARTALGLMLTGVVSLAACAPSSGTADSARVARAPDASPMADPVADGRELEIWASSGGDLPRLTATQRRVHDTWAKLRADVVAHGGAQEAGRFGALVARLDAARTAAEYGALATPILDEVDALENVFTR